ncbi:MAG: RDD family protein [Anaerolineae bacterium]|jgi:uncharacterized RDD family membrane protein YckC
MSDEQVPYPIPLGRYAGFITRLAAFIIDRSIVSIILFIMVWSVQWAANAFAINLLLFTEGTPWQMSLALTAGLYLLFSILYDVGFWMLAGQTLGKRVMGVRVVRTDGKRLKFGNALRREIGYVLSAILFLGYLWILFDNRRQGFHDKLAGTMVVYSWPEDELQGTFVRDRVAHIRYRIQAKRDSEGVD